MPSRKPALHLPSSSELLSFSPEVSNTRLAGRMWPARCLCVARANFSKTVKHINFDKILTYFEGLYCKLRRAVAF
jgi:hypothetical protein